jgi:EAL domain-containing protein (putative c-di-GMP-specific phosphodiesterase class I)/ActR/RegA family two-component response regulator
MKEEVSAALSELRFLVVEDHGFQRWTLGNHLRQSGAKAIFFAADGKEALEIFSSANPAIDVIVTDLNMPGMDGMEFVRHLGEFGIPVSIVLVSSLDRALLSSVSTMVRAYGVTLLDALEKPVTARKLEAAILKYKPAVEPPRSVALPSFSQSEIAEGMQREEFEAYFQPKIDLRTGALKGAEALARWRHPLRGVTMPSSFVPLMESSRKIDEFTVWMLHQAARSCREWRSAGISATVSVNVSLLSLTDVGIAERYVKIVREHDIEPRDVILEITETAAPSELARVLENLSRLRMMGFGLALDDYGTGYSSMEQLTHIPFTELKIDQSFVRAALTEQSGRAILESSLEMADKLRITAVAEGVETPEQATLLLELGCELAQGLFIARPMAEADFMQWAKAHVAKPAHEFIPRQVRFKTNNE